MNAQRQCHIHLCRVWRLSGRPGGEDIEFHEGPSAPQRSAVVNVPYVKGKCSVLLEETSAFDPKGERYAREREARESADARKAREHTRVLARSVGKHWVITSNWEVNAPKRSHAEPKRYRVGSLVDGGWMHLDGWHYRARKRGNVRARAYTSRSTGMYTEWCCELVLYTPLVETAISRHERHDSLQQSLPQALYVLPIAMPQHTLMVQLKQNLRKHKLRLSLSLPALPHPTEVSSHANVTANFKVSLAVKQVGKVN
ncbi:uncharacterized protein F5891DRAFT_1168949 [Suillus fuscotomentosus]|uniref:Uncharacterized protein n=1 Tax=Suillus fuscotomentosus TaxID=1912939 RepID=A0AAD4HSS9_9AGAM|nr:uncharacterized protein F5891DRAFT_1168949 [Suillus fuscotomentosus]KAG1907693.1 hypothetical protein F5891DRAFT_1168949 [Suillus fuscotomentosus]